MLEQFVSDMRFMWKQFEKQMNVFLHIFVKASTRQREGILKLICKFESNLTTTDNLQEQTNSVEDNCTASVNRV